MKIVKLSFINTPDWYEIVIGNKIMIGKLQCKGWLWSISGLGLLKSERKIFNVKLFEFRNILTVYLGKILISYDKRGYKEHCSSCDIVYEMPLFGWLKFRASTLWKYNISKWLLSKANQIIHKFFFKKQYTFVVERAYEPTKVIRTDMLTAYQLAVNYEADLLLNGRYLLSCLGFDWEENNALIQKNLGMLFRFNRLFGYADYSDVEVIR